MSDPTEGDHPHANQPAVNRRRILQAGGMLAMAAATAAAGTAAAAAPGAPEAPDPTGGFGQPPGTETRRRQLRRAAEIPPAGMTSQDARPGFDPGRGAGKMGETR